MTEISSFLDQNYLLTLNDKVLRQNVDQIKLMMKFTFFYIFQ